MTDVRPAHGAARSLALAAVLFAAAFALSRARSESAEVGVQPPASEQRSSCWVLVDMDSFFCGACLDHLLEFSRAVPARVQEERVRGILVFGGSAGPEETRRRAEVVRTKWQGFSRANDIRFPAAVDADMAFSGLLKAGIGVLVFDARAGAVRRYPLPVPRGRLEEIMRILVD
jgi:hypothetical protein